MKWFLKVRKNHEDHRVSLSAGARKLNLKTNTCSIYYIKESFNYNLLYFNDLIFVRYGQDILAKGGQGQRLCQCRKSIQ